MEIVLRAKQSKVLQFMVGMVQNKFVCEKLLQLCDVPRGESRYMVDVVNVVLPLLLKERFAVLM